MEDDKEIAVVCPGCEDICLESAFYEESTDKFYVDCGYKTEMGLVEIDKDYIERCKKEERRR